MTTREKVLERRVKAALDRMGAALLLVLLAPLMLAIGAWIAFESGRPVLFVHPRAGKEGEPFQMLKFRTMVQDAVELGRRLRLSEDPFGIVPKDPRITRSGRFLRRTGFDELPQIVNVLRGEMSFVGPRPDLVEQAAGYSREERRRLEVKPGITGWSQIHGREDMTWPERFRYDFWYLDNWSLRLDLRILLRTFGQIFRGEPEPVQDALNIERARVRSVSKDG